MKKTKQFSCPNCGKGRITFKIIEEKVKDAAQKMHLVKVRVGLCDHCKERLWPRESMLQIEQIRHPAVYTLEIPSMIADRLIRKAALKNKSFKQLALEKLAK